MSVNKYRPHVWMIPEDDANRQLAIGFLMHHAAADRTVGVAAPAGGWMVALDILDTEYLPLLRSNQNAHVVLLLDFDNDNDRSAYCEGRVADDVKDRVFVISSLVNPESLKKAMKMSFESIGIKLAEECFGEQFDYWNHEQLVHNKEELERLQSIVRPILFPNV